jgi:hypothetical protein
MQLIIPNQNGLFFILFLMNLRAFPIGRSGPIAIVFAIPCIGGVALKETATIVTPFGGSLQHGI